MAGGPAEAKTEEIPSRSDVGTTTAKKGMRQMEGNCERNKVMFNQPPSRSHRLSQKG